jgi:hypothetical protein
METSTLNIDPSQVPDSVIKLSSLQEKLNQSIVTATEHIEKPPICFEVKDGELSSEIGTLGNLSLWIGKAKQGKTFAISMALAAAETCDWLQDKIKISLPADQKTVLHFDTEQSRYHVQRVVKRIAKLADIAEPMNMTAFGLRKYSAADRLEMVEYAIYNTDNLGFVVIDGIRDLITSINDEEQSSMIVSKLMKWSEELNIHIAVVLHTNKADTNARGHIGTELTNKSETVISIGKHLDEDTLMVVKAEFCRNRAFNDFGFTVDDFGIPQIYDGAMLVKKEGKKTLTPVDIDPSVHSEILDAIFKIEPQINYKNLQSQVKDYFMRHGIKFGENKSVEFITYYINNKLITKIKGQSRYAFYIRTL